MQVLRETGSGDQIKRNDGTRYVSTRRNTAGVRKVVTFDDVKANKQSNKYTDTRSNK